MKEFDDEINVRGKVLTVEGKYTVVDNNRNEVLDIVFRKFEGRTVKISVVAV